MEFWKLKAICIRNLTIQHVFTFGSVPLKTYLPDGDIDLTAFSNNQNLKDTWANQVRDMLKNEEKNENAEFRVKEVQYIQAEDLSLAAMIKLPLMRSGNSVDVTKAQGWHP
ncbi:hypothetical protein CsSME_00023741 [Camellia sinensis var. sinensis]